MWQIIISYHNWHWYARYRCKIYSRICHHCARLYTWVVRTYSQNECVFRKFFLNQRKHNDIVHTDYRAATPTATKSTVKKMPRFCAMTTKQFLWHLLSAKLPFTFKQKNHCWHKYTSQVLVNVDKWRKIWRHQFQLDERCFHFDAVILVYLVRTLRIYNSSVDVANIILEARRKNYVAYSCIAAFAMIRRMNEWDLNS